LISCLLRLNSYHRISEAMPSPTHKHFRRLDSVWIEHPVYFLTLCVAGRRPLLANEAAVAVLRAEFEVAPARYGWSVGRFVAMPDHLHFFCVSSEAASASSLSRFMAGFKQWTA
jgi:putative transposase